MEEIKPLPEVFGTMDHLHNSVKVYCEMMEIFGLDLKLSGIRPGPTSGMMEQLLAQQRKRDESRH